MGIHLVALIALALGTWARGDGATQYKITTDDKGVRAIQGQPCSYVREQLAAIRAWTESLGEKPGTYPKPVITGADECRFDLETSLPSLALETCGRTIACNGPNCLNACLVGKKMIPYLRYTDAEEFDHWLDSDLCVLVPPGEERRPGDFIVLRGRTNGKVIDVHAMQFITPDLVFQKTGADAKSAYSFGSPRDAFDAFTKLFADHYGVRISQQPDDCMWRLAPEGCTFFGQIYRCETMREPSAQSPPYKKFKGEISALECQISKNALNGPSPPNPLKIQMRIALEVLRKNVDDLIETTPATSPDDGRKTSSERFLLESLRTRIASLAAQIEAM